VWIGEETMFCGHKLKKQQEGKHNILVHRPAGCHKPIREFVLTGDYTLYSDDEVSDIIVSLTETHFCLNQQTSVLKPEIKEQLQQLNIVRVL
jgi:hypothetical protein